MSKLSQEEKARIAQDAQQGRDIARANYPEISDERYNKVFEQVRAYEQGGNLPDLEDQELFNHLLYDPYRQTQEVYHQLDAGHKVFAWKSYDPEILDVLSGGKGLYVVNEGDGYSYISLSAPEFDLGNTSNESEPDMSEENSAQSLSSTECYAPTSDKYVEPHLGNIFYYLGDEDIVRFGRFRNEYYLQISMVNAEASKNCITIEETEGYGRLIELKNKHESLLVTYSEYAEAFETAENKKNKRSHYLQEMIKNEADEAIKTISEGLSKLPNARIPISKYTGELLDTWRENGSLTVEDLLTFVENDPYEAEKSILAIMRALDPSQQNAPYNTASGTALPQQTVTTPPKP